MAETSRKKRRKAKKSRRSPVGAAPGTLTADPAAHRTTLRLTAISPERIERIESPKVADLPALMQQWPVIWLDCVGLGDVDTIGEIGTVFGFHRLSLEDVVNTDQRPKAEFFENHAFVVLKMLDARPDALPEQLSLFFGEKFVVTFQERPGDAFDPVRKRIADHAPRIVTRKADYLAYALLDAVIDGYFPAADASGEEIDRLEDEMLSQPQLNRSRDLHILRREMIALKRWLWPARDAVAGLIRSDAGFITDETRLFLADTQDHVVRLIEIVETYRDMLTGLIDMNLSLVQARTNDIVSLLTIISAIFIPLTFLVGVWGMNFDPNVSPWNMPELEWRYGYPAALGLMALVGVALVGYFKWKKWL